MCTQHTALNAKLNNELVRLKRVKRERRQEKKRARTKLMPFIDNPLRIPGTEETRNKKQKSRFGIKVGMIQRSTISTQSHHNRTSFRFFLDLMVPDTQHTQHQRGKCCFLLLHTVDPVGCSSSTFALRPARLLFLRISSPAPLTV